MTRTANSASAPRIKRTPISGRNVLTVTGKEPGYQYRIVNDEPDRIAQFLDAGYELVDSSQIRVGDRRVDAGGPEGSKAQVAVGKGTKAFVMRIPKEYFLEDQKAKQDQIDKLEQSIKNPALNKADYGSVSISTGRPS